MSTDRNELAATLAEIDQIVARVESHKAQPDEPNDAEAQALAQAMLDTVLAARQAVEWELRAADG